MVHNHNVKAGTATQHGLATCGVVFCCCPKGLLLNAVLQLVADSEREIREYATETNNDLLQLVRKTPEPLDFSVLLHKLRKELQSKDPIVRQQSLSWVAMLLEKNEGQVLSVLEDFWFVTLWCVYNRSHQRD